MTPLIQPHEFKIDTWSIFYIPPAGGKYHGKLTITNKRLFFDWRNGSTIKWFLPDAIEANPIGWATEGFLEINKTEITDIEVEKTALAKKVIVVLSDGNRHTFSYGTLNIDKVVEAIKSR